MDKFARNLDWNLLYTFMVIVQEEGMVPAAERLLVTQPAVSLALKRLEETTGVRLIERGSGKLAMTSAGEALYPEACKVYASICRLPVSFEQAPKSVTGKISIATISKVVSEDFDTALSESRGAPVGLMHIDLDDFKSKLYSCFTSSFEAHGS